MLSQLQADVQAEPWNGCSTVDFVSVPALKLERENFVSAITIGQADFNSDGWPDLVVGALDSLWVYLGSGDGSFQFRDQFEAFYPTRLVTADFNRDGKMDFACSTGFIVSVYLGNGDATFQPPISVDTGGISPLTIRIGDFNHDQIPDMAVLNLGNGRLVNGVFVYDNSNVASLVGFGDGTFDQPYTYPVDSAPWSAVVCDLNGDGKEDLAVAVINTDEVWGFLGNGTGAFAEGVKYRAATSLPPLAVGDMSIAAADFNGDGKIDIAISGKLPRICILAGNGDGSLQAPLVMELDRSQGQLEALDLDHDGKADLIGQTQGPPAITVRRGVGDGTFMEAAAFAVGAGAIELTIGDLNGDGGMDFATVNNPGTVSILLNACTPPLQLSSWRRGLDGLTVGWKGNAVGYVLESSTRLGQSDWQPIVNRPETTNGLFQVHLALTNGVQQYFRLRKP